MKIMLTVVLLLCSMFMSSSQTGGSKSIQDTSVRHAATKYFEWRKKMIEDTASARHARWCNELKEAKEETDSLVAAYRYRQWLKMRKQTKQQ